MSQRLRRLPFVTGSRVYGKPKLGSDVDLVVLWDFDMPYDEAATLCSLADFSDGSGDSSSFRFGQLDIIAVDEKEYDQWWRARERCLAEHPVTRERAIEIHEQEMGRRPND